MKKECKRVTYWVIQCTLRVVHRATRKKTKVSRRCLMCDARNAMRVPHDRFLKIRETRIN